MDRLRASIDVRADGCHRARLALRPGSRVRAIALAVIVPTLVTVGRRCSFAGWAVRARRLAADAEPG